MLMHDGIDFAGLALGQVPAPAPVAPAAPAGTQTIPIVAIGPAVITDSAGQPVQGARATLRTPARILKMVDVPGGVFQTVVDRSDFDAGLHIIFGAPDRAPVSVAASSLFCNFGTRNEHGIVTSMGPNPCQTKPITFDPAQVVERAPQDRGQRRGEEASAPAAVAPVHAAAPAPEAKPRKRRRGKKSRPGAAAVAPAPSAVLLTQQATDPGTSPLVYAGIGAGVLAVGLIVYLMAK